MDLEQANEILRTQLIAAASGLPQAVEILWENRRTLDLQDRDDPYLEVELIPATVTPASLGNYRLLRERISFAMIYWVKEGEGVRNSYAVRDYLSSALSVRDFSGLITEALHSSRMVREDGWYGLPMLLPCWFDRVEARP